MNIIQKTRDDYNKIAKHFAATRQQQGAGELEKFRPFIEGGQYILDWGCGSGRLLCILIDTDVHYYGVDQSSALLKHAKKEHAKEVKSGRAKFFCTANKEKKFSAEFFDLVFMVASFHHLPDEKSRGRLLKKVFHEMKSDARLIITVWNLESNWAREKFKGEWKRLKNNDYLIPWKDQAGQVRAMRYYHHFTKLELIGLLEKTGFTIEELYYSKGNEKATKKLAKNLVVVARK